MTKPTGRPRGRPPKPSTRFAEQVRESMQRQADALLDVTDALIDRARGIRIFQVRDLVGIWREPSGEQAQALLADDNMVQALLMSGAARIYAKEPDLDAGKVVMDRIMGKVPTVVELHLRKRVEQLNADHALIAKVIREHVPDEYLGTLIPELERIAGRSQAAAGEYAQVAD